LSLVRANTETPPVITNVIIHLHGDLPIVVDMEALPAGTDRSVTCSNVRTVDGKRPSFVHDRHSTFVFPLSGIRLIEAPPPGSETSDEFEAQEPLPALPAPAPAPAEVVDEEPDEDLLARIRSV
jgi:hypothetical protein